jgi:hypothetical protein
MSALFEARATKERVLHLPECAEYVFPRTICLICRIPFVNRMALVHGLAKVSMELIEFIIYYQVKLFTFKKYI